MKDENNPDLREVVNVFLQKEGMHDKFLQQFIILLEKQGNSEKDIKQSLNSFFDMAMESMLKHQNSISFYFNFAIEDYKPQRNTPEIQEILSLNQKERLNKIASLIDSKMIELNKIYRSLNSFINFISHHPTKYWDIALTKHYANRFYQEIKKIENHIKNQPKELRDNEWIQWKTNNALQICLQLFLAIKVLLPQYYLYVPSLQELNQISTKPLGILEHIKALSKEKLDYTYLLTFKEKMGNTSNPINLIISQGQLFSTTTSSIISKHSHNILQLPNIETAKQTIAKYTKIKIPGYSDFYTPVDKAGKPIEEISGHEETLKGFICQHFLTLFLPEKKPQTTFFQQLPKKPHNKIQSQNINETPVDISLNKKIR